MPDDVNLTHAEFWEIFVALENSVGINSTGELEDVLTLQDRAYEVIRRVARRNAIHFPSMERDPVRSSAPLETP